MSTYAGSDGIVVADNDLIAQVKSWSLEESSEALDCSSIGTSWRQFRPSIKGWAGSVEGFWHDDDPGQGRITTGSMIELALYPSGQHDMHIFFKGNAIVTSISRQGSFDGMVEVSFNFQGSGALNQGRVGEQDARSEPDDSRDRGAGIYKGVKGDSTLDYVNSADNPNVKTTTQDQAQDFEILEDKKDT